MEIITCNKYFKFQVYRWKLDRIKLQGLKIHYQLTTERSIRQNIFSLKIRYCDLFQLTTLYLNSSWIVSLFEKRRMCSHV